MPPEPPPTTITRNARLRTILAIIALALLALAAGAGQASAHNPACVQVAGADGPHYDDSDRTGSETAFNANPNLRGPDQPESTHPDHATSIHNREGSCSVGNAPTGGGGH